MNPFQSVISPTSKTPQALGAIKASALDQQQWYLRHLLPWPQAGEAGEIVLAWSKNDGTWPHRGVRTQHEAERLIAFLQSDPTVEGVFAAQAMMSGQRSAANAVAFGSVWLDLDEKDFRCPGDNDQSVLDRILVELGNFTAVAGLPQPSVTIASGGGAHCYWLFTSQITRDRWEQIARGLAECVKATGFRADIRCTTDAARLLRIAGTFNRKPKYVTPKAVEILSPESGPPVRYDAASIEGIVAKFGDCGAADSGLVRFPRRTPLTGVEELGAGVDGGWFSQLPVEVTNDVVNHALKTLATQTKYLELGRHGGDNGQYYRIMQACARSGVPDAEDLWVKYASRAKEADGEEKLRSEFRRCAQASSRLDGVTVGTLLHLAQQHGADFTRWKRPTASNSSPASSNSRASSNAAGRAVILKGGTYAAHDALSLLNERYLVGETDDETAIFRIRRDATLAFVNKEQFQLELANITVQITDAHGRVTLQPAAKFWLQHPSRHRRTIAFNPRGTTGPDEYNLWRGFSVVPQGGWQKQRRFLRHLREIVCRRDRGKFKYLLRWLAFAVQHPDKHPETVLVLMSSTEGTGKSTVGWVMLQIFGHHGLLVDEQDRLLGRFTEHLETVCFVVAEEMMWAGEGNGKNTDKLKSRITAETILIEAKFRRARAVPNRMHVIMTTNHEHAVKAGVRDRRYVVLDVADHVAQSKAWFDPLYADLKGGGISQFLHLLLNINLRDWHPREIIKTAEAGEQQRLSADSMAQWMQACIDADAIIGSVHGLSSDLSKTIASEVLREAYTGYCNQNRLRALSVDAFSKRLSAMFGPRKRLPQQGGRRPWGYQVCFGVE